MLTNKKNDKIPIGSVIDIQRFSLHDGPGIRTTVFLKGCPLRCLWCHNPESQEYYSELSYVSQKCINCGKCVEACKYFCHAMQDGKHLFDRSNCIRCFSCVEVCYNGALKKIGELVTVTKVLNEVLKDTKYYKNSGGGLTVSGGEPMMQLDFLQSLVVTAKQQGLNVCVDTCGQAPFSSYLAIKDYVDIFLYDFKESDPKLHEEFTGVSNKLIIDNLFNLDRENAKTIMRCPIIPGFNDREDHFCKIGEVSMGLKNIIGVNVMPFHPYGNNKSIQVGKALQMADTKVPSQNTVDSWINRIRKYTNVPVIKG